MNVNWRLVNYKNKKPALRLGTLTETNSNLTLTGKPQMTPDK